MAEKWLQQSAEEVLTPLTVFDQLGACITGMRSVARQSPAVPSYRELYQVIQRQLIFSRPKLVSAESYCRYARSGKVSPNIGFPLLDCSLVASS
jgi:hypothetical protein